MDLHESFVNRNRDRTLAPCQYAITSLFNDEHVDALDAWLSIDVGISALVARFASSPPCFRNKP